MSDIGLYALTKVFAGALSAVTTGPLGSTDLPDVDLSAAISGNTTGYSAQVYGPDGTSLGFSGQGSGASPSVMDLPDRFIQALLSVEDARFGSHPGVDPVAVAAAAVDTLRGNRRGGSTLTQQVVKNAITGSDQTMDRKVREAILAVRVQDSLPPERIIQGYLANAWFGRGQDGAMGAARAWFGKEWADIELHEAAFLAGILKGPAYYDPVKYPDRARGRRDTVLRMMRARDMITDEEMAVAISMPLDVISTERSDTIMGSLPRWTASGIHEDMSRYGLTSRSDIASGILDITTTISADWQTLAQDALSAGISRIGGSGPAYRVDSPIPAYGEALTGEAVAALRKEAASGLATTRKTGRIIVTSATGGEVSAIVDRGYGDLEWEKIDFDEGKLGFAPRKGDVLAYRRVEDEIILLTSPQVQGSVVVMDPWSGAVLASVGGTDPDLYPFDRSRAMRQPGSSLKPFLWARAMEEGLRYSDMVEDIERSYPTNTGEVWRPRNYDGSQSGLIPLFVALEESSNLVAASLVDRLGIDALGQITEIAGVYDWGGMRRHPSSALGASETTLTRMAAGYAAFANGGLVVSPHHISKIAKNGRALWTPRGPDGYAIATQYTTDDISSMLYGVTARGTAYSAFRDLKLPVAGKTGTTQDYRDAWFMSYTPGVVVAVWVGRDDFKPIPGNLSGSRAAAPIAKAIYASALKEGLLNETGHRADQDQRIDWPPALLDMNGRRGNTRGGYVADGYVVDDPFKRPEAGAVFIQRDTGSTAVEDLRPVDGLDAILNAPEQAAPITRAGEEAWFDRPQSARGYLDGNDDPNAIFTRPSRQITPPAPTGNPVFKNPW
jgi:penicillin-binding protein 1A